MARLLSMLFIIAICGLSSVAQEPKIGDKHLPTLFADDFREDTREDYEVWGPVEWKAGNLVLGESARIRKTIDAGTRVDIGLSFEIPAIANDGNTFKTQLRLTFLGASDLVLVWSVDRDQEASKALLSVYDTPVNPGILPTGDSPEADEKQRTLVRQWSLPKMTSDWHIAYRDGLIRIRPADDDSGDSAPTIYRAYVLNNGAFVTAFALDQRQNSVWLDKVSVKADSPKYFDEQQLGEYQKALEITTKLLAAERPSDLAVAIKQAEEARDIWKRILGPEHPSYATPLGISADLYFESGDFAQAETMLLEAIRIDRTHVGNDHPNFAIHINDLALVYDSIGEYAKAEELLLESRRIVNEVWGPDSDAYAMHLNNLGRHYQVIGEFARAEQSLVESCDLAQKIYGESHPRCLGPLNNLGLLYELIGQHERALSLLLKVRDISAKNPGPNHPSYAAHVNNLGVTYRAMGNYVEAERCFGEAANVLQNAVGKDSPDVALVLDNLASVYSLIGEHKRAEKLIVDVCDVHKRSLGPKHPDYATSLSHLAECYAALGESEKADSLYLESFQVLQAAAEKTLPSLSEAEAKNWLANRYPSLTNLFAQHSQEGNRDAETLYGYVWQTKAMCTRLRLQAQITDDASPEAQQAFSDLQSARRKLARMVSATPTAEQRAAVELAIQDAAQEKEALEKKLARLHLSSKRQLSVRDATVNDLLAALPKDVAVIDFVLVPAEVPLEVEIEVLHDGKTETRKVNRKRTELHYEAFVLRSGAINQQSSVEWVSLGSVDAIDTLIADWRRELSDVSQSTSASRVGQKLREFIWEKIEPHLQGCSTVITIPDASLTAVPWAALPGREPNSFLIEDYALATANYGQELFGLLTDDAPNRDKLLVCGGVDYDHRSSISPLLTAAGEKQISLAASTRAAIRGDKLERWESLPGTREEADSILQTYKRQSSGKNHFLTNENAGEHELAKALVDSRYVHLATHGFFAAPGIKSIFPLNPRAQASFRGQSQLVSEQTTIGGRNPLLLSGVVLAGANLEAVKDEIGLPTGADGILTAEEVIALDLHGTDLVTLSACETGLGDVAAGEGVFGLQRAFHQAGARTVIASLWKVDDSATQALMIEFYKNLWERKLSKLESLRQAQLRMLLDFQPANGELRGAGSARPVDAAALRQAREKIGQAQRLSPFYWAAFTLSGDWR